MQTLDEIGNLKGHSTAEARWATFGPYYAMFPIAFAFDVVNKFSSKGDAVLDPFAGRCSSIYAASVLGRKGVGIEINPVGWIYGKVKLSPAPIALVEERLRQICERSVEYSCQAKNLPPFFQFCYCEEVLLFLLACRSELDWENSPVDATLMAIVLVFLHGKLGEGLSNQMRQTKAMGPEYSINWWREKEMDNPPKIDPYNFILSKIKWRYEKGVPHGEVSRIIFGDSTVELPRLKASSTAEISSFSLLFTSPPYYSVTNYHADQWLRLWMLGGTPSPSYDGHKHKGRFMSKEKYKALLESVFSQSASMMRETSTIYVRTDARQFTLETTKEVLRKCFPHHKMEEHPKPFHSKTQTELFGDKSKKPGEMDIILSN